MGEYSEMMLDGTLCQGCGEYIGLNDGIPGWCSGCDPNRIGAYPKMQKVSCPHCSKKVKGLEDHIKAAHPLTQGARRVLRSEAPEQLDKAGIAWTTNNGGVHLMVAGPHGRIDFWPGPGKWQDVKLGKRGNSLAELLLHVKSEKAKLK